MNAPLAIATTFSLAPANLTEALKFAEMMAQSELVPKDYRSKPGNVLIAVQMGAEVGLQPMAAIQNIAVINGKPGIYGDAGKAILLAAGCQIEEDDIKLIKERGYASCTITRNGKQTTRTYGIDNAKTAKLWGKEGPWSTNPERQMAWRAFWFAARDAAADLLKGLSGAEELRDYTPVEREINATPERGEPVKDAYPDEKFKTNLPTWRQNIAEGRNTADGVIATVETKYTLTDEQKAEIRKPIEKPTEHAQPTDAQANAQLSEKDKIAGQLNRATSLDVLDIAADLISSLPSAEDRNELTSLYQNRKGALQGGAK